MCPLSERTVIYTYKPRTLGLCHNFKICSYIYSDFFYAVMKIAFPHLFSNRLFTGWTLYIQLSKSELTLYTSERRGIRRRLCRLRETYHRDATSEERLQCRHHDQTVDQYSAGVVAWLFVEMCTQFHRCHISDIWVSNCLLKK